MRKEETPGTETSGTETPGTETSGTETPGTAKLQVTKKEPVLHIMHESINIIYNYT